MWTNETMQDGTAGANRPAAAGRLGAIHWHSWAPLRRAGVAALLLCAGGCVWEHENRGKVDLGVEVAANPQAGSAAFRDTIGAVSYYEGMGPMRVRGYGVVVGLGRNGSRDCPRAIYDQIVQNLYKQYRFVGDRIGERSVKPEQMLDSLDTAVVLVQGDIPPVAVEGSRFDVTVTALPGTQTKSLEGGRLFPVELQVYREASTGTTAGKTLALATGPLFTNPFADEQSATRVSSLQATILGGGRVAESRRVRLVLTQPSYALARRIQDRLNARFPGSPRTADATSPSFVQLQVPEEFHEDTGHFLALVRSLLLHSDPNAEATRARELGQEMLDPAAAHAQIALTFEGLGRAALPVLRDLYAHPKEYVTFHAGVAGLRLGDHLAGDAMTLLANNPQSEFRFSAIRALGEARGMGATAIALRKLLHDDDSRVCVAAYEALVRRGDPEIHSQVIAGDNFVLDIIPDVARPLVYVRRTGERRIALFGHTLRCTPPIVYRAPQGRVTLTAQPGDEALTVVRTASGSGAMSPPLDAPFEVPALTRLLGSEADVDADGQVVGFGLGYGDVVRVLWQLCRDGAIEAPFVQEQPNTAELFGPAQPGGRPESEL